MRNYLLIYGLVAVSGLLAACQHTPMETTKDRSPAQATVLYGVDQGTGMGVMYAPPPVGSDSERNDKRIKGDWEKGFISSMYDVQQRRIIPSTINFEGYDSFRIRVNGVSFDPYALAYTEEESKKNNVNELRQLQQTRAEAICKSTIYFPNVVSFYASHASNNTKSNLVYTYYYPESLKQDQVQIHQAKTVTEIVGYFTALICSTYKKN